MERAKLNRAIEIVSTIKFLEACISKTKSTLGIIKNYDEMDERPYFELREGGHTSSVYRWISGPKSKEALIICCQTVLADNENLLINARRELDEL